MMETEPLSSSEPQQAAEPCAASPLPTPAGDAPAAAAEPETAPSAPQALAVLTARLDQLEQTQIQLIGAINQLSERVDLLPRQIRQLGGKVDSITESVSEPRLRDLLMNLLLLYDLAEQMGRAAEADAAAGHNYRVLRDQIAQMLRVNGIEPIVEAPRFDPALHKAVETTPCAAAEEDGEIVRVCRTGFRTERAILRYAEVIVKRHQPSV
jgi:molecular chaperone GrpE (heat shock protein)